MKQRVDVKSTKSKWAPGVHQGTVLGPLLVSLCINDIMDDIDSEIRVFASDCVFHRPIHGIGDTVKLPNDI